VLELSYNLVDMKLCNGCDTEKPLEAFDKEKRNTGSKGQGVASRCKECRRAQEKDWRAKNPEQVTSYQQGYYKKNARVQSVQKFSRKAGIPFALEDYEELFTGQNGQCAICQTPIPKGNGSFHIDHCHLTKTVRGLLCHHCNVGIGNLKDDPELLEKAASYLRLHSSSAISS
jgi:hypothetical protein